jgi:hypothetical protein
MNGADTSITNINMTITSSMSRGKSSVFGEIILTATIQLPVAPSNNSGVCIGEIDDKTDSDSYRINVNTSIVGSENTSTLVFNDPVNGSPKGDPLNGETLVVSGFQFVDQLTGAASSNPPPGVTVKGNSLVIQGTPESSTVFANLVGYGILIASNTAGKLSVVGVVDPQLETED